MADDKTGADKRKKITIVLIVVVIGVLAWQVAGLFGGNGGGGDDFAPASSTQVASVPTIEPKPAQQMQATNEMQVAEPLPMTPREMELLKLQQETQAKYVQATNELQMLKLTLEIAETNKNIMAAKYDTVKSQKDIVDLLAPKEEKPTPRIRQNFGTLGDLQRATQQPQQAQQPQQPQQPPQQQAVQEPRPVQTMPTEAKQPEEPDVAYTVVSVSKLQNKWSAVIGVQGSLYNIHVGDVIPVDGSTVKSISSSGIVLERKGKTRKVSLVPII